MNEIDNYIKILDKSPLFNLSLASKELFHSNFLAWAIKYNKAFREVFIQKIAPDINFDWNGDFKVERERHNFDLKILVAGESGAHHQIVIENKVKSLPDEKQLRRYAKKLRHCNPVAILLSLTKPDFFDCDRSFLAEDVGWKFFGYQTVVDALKVSENNSDYNTALFSDYCQFLEALLDLKKALENLFDNNEAALLDPFNWPLNKEISLYEQLKTIRMHDVFEKWRMQKIKTLLLDKLKKQTAEKLIFNLGFTRGLGLLDITHKDVKPDQDKAYFKIQIQGQQLRQVLEKNKANGDELLELAEPLVGKREWFCDENGSPLPGKRGETSERSFCRYGNVFLYRHEVFKDFSRLAGLVEKLAKRSFCD
jgi:hypothetical protein